MAALRRNSLNCSTGRGDMYTDELSNRGSVKTYWSRVLVAAAICLLASCGGGSSMATNLAEAGVFAHARTICREYNNHIYRERALEGKGKAALGPGPFLARKEAEVASLRSVMGSVDNLPHVGTYLLDLSEQLALLSALSRELRKGHASYFRLALSKSYITESRRLNVKVATDAKALDLIPCIGPSPRRAIAG